MSFTLTAFVRSTDLQGKGASRRLRKQNLIPAIVYGKGEPVSISIKNNELVRALEEDAFFTSPITLTLENGNETVTIKALQRHPSKGVPLHVDFVRA
ncbi:50S ribosomal protein L25 [Moraxella oblonga]|uniref:50S ribosomal protein L25 n=1 Tax=Moraxella oblonga TaxID=200413 RepID=UPI00083555DF|nr:50S ribosomal protein L25 [Moraxella oblonga]